MFAFAPVKKISDNVFVLEYVLNESDKWENKLCIVLLNEKKITSIDENITFDNADFDNAKSALLDLN